MKNRIPLFESRISLKEFLEKGNSQFVEPLQNIGFKIDFVRREFQRPWKFSLYTGDYSVPDNFKFYQEKRNAYHSNFSPYDLNVSYEAREKDYERIKNGPKITKIKFYFYKDEEILKDKFRIFLEDEELENGRYDLLCLKTDNGIFFPRETEKIQKFFSNKNMSRDLLRKFMNEFQERKSLNFRSKIF